MATLLTVNDDCYAIQNLFELYGGFKTTLQIFQFFFQVPFKLKAWGM